MSESTLTYLTAALPLPDVAFEEYWALYLKQRPQLVAGSTVELEREQLRILFKLSFLAGRHAATSELALLKQS